MTSRKARDAFRSKLREPVVADPECRRLPKRRTVRIGTEASGEAAKAAKPRARGTAAFEPDGIEDRKLTLSQGPSALEFVGFLADGVSVLLVDVTPNAEGNGSTLTGTVRGIGDTQRDEHCFLASTISAAPR